jgi:hypothetical protein
VTESHNGAKVAEQTVEHALGQLRQDATPTLAHGDHHAIAIARFDCDLVALDLAA